MTVYTPDPLRDQRHKSARAYPLVAEWLDERELEGKAARTLDGDERYTAALLNSYPALDLEQYGATELKAFLTKVPAASRRKYAAHFTSLFKWGVLNDHIDRNPMERVPSFSRPKQKVIDVFSDAEVEVLSHDPLYLLLFDTGVRASEALALQVKHITFRLPEEGASTISILKGKGDKGRVIPLTDRLRRALADFEVTEGLRPDDYLWGDNPGGHYPRLRRTKQAGATTLKSWHRRSLERAGIPYRKFHTTRHTMATRFLRHGVSLLTVSRMLGHASVKTTADSYAHMVVEDQAAELALMEV